MNLTWFMANAECQDHRIDSLNFRLCHSFDVCLPAGQTGILKFEIKIRYGRVGIELPSPIPWVLSSLYFHPEQRR